MEIKIDYDLEIITCGNCGTVHAIPKALYESAQKDNSSWYCPRGCSLTFTKTKYDKQLERANSYMQSYYDASEERNLLKKERTKLRRELTNIKKKLNGI